MSKFKKIDLSRVSTHSIKDRASKVQIDNLGKATESNPSINDFIDSLPKFLKADDFRQIVAQMKSAIEKQKRIVFMIGAHNLKVGLTPLYVDFMKHYNNLHFAGNGAVAIHDLEIAFFGETSEDVKTNLQDGTFGFAKETGELYAQVLAHANKNDIGLGQSVGEVIKIEDAPNKEFSLAYNCLVNDIPLTIHSSIGTEIVNQHPGFDGAACGQATFDDFKIFANSISEIDNGGVALNIGSAVIMPEVFLKAVAICRNLNKDFGNFTTANFDMIPHYRPSVNVVGRPSALDSEGYHISGHHEIMIPLLLAAVKS